MEISRPEHPTPQWERKNWRNLNGEWDFEFDFGRSAYSKWLRPEHYFDNLKMTKKINVPFCPESMLSGIGYTVLLAASAIGDISVCQKKSWRTGWFCTSVR